MKKDFFIDPNVQRLLWPMVALAGILLFNLVFTPGFFHIELKDGRFFGSLVDIANRAAPMMLLAWIGVMPLSTNADISRHIASSCILSGLAASVPTPM